MKIKTFSLINDALDWAAAEAHGNCYLTLYNGIYVANFDSDTRGGGPFYDRWQPSKNWADGGPIIDKFDITVGPWTTSPAMAHMVGEITTNNPRVIGPTKLIAAMRCLVFSKFGDEVDIPDEISSL